MPDSIQGRCLKCGSMQQVKTYESINTSKDPSLKEKVLDGSLFTWTCPHCGTVNLVTAPTLYHDPEGKLMVWLMPKGALSAEQAAAVEKSMDAVSGSLRNDPAMDGYTLRRVDSVGDLIEKVNIHEAGLDDVAIEMCKYVTRIEMSLSEAAFKFYRLEGPDNDIIFTYPKDGKMMGVKTGFKVYGDCCGILSRNPAVRPAPGFARVDAAWLSERMG